MIKEVSFFIMLTKICKKILRVNSFINLLVYSLLRPIQNFALWIPLILTKGDYCVPSDPTFNFLKCFKKELNVEM